MPSIVLLSDFGTRDHWVAVMKAVMRDICPAADFLDITHHIPPQDLRAAALTLLNAWRWFPSGTVFLTVVDPGVGSARRPLVATAAGHCFVAPDNGLLTWALADAGRAQVYAALDPTWYLEDPSQTFHGRDIFAPLAAHLADGVAPARLGTPIDDACAMPLPILEIAPGRLRGEVLQADHFGNLTTSLGAFHRVGREALEFTPRFGGCATISVPLDAHIRAGNCRLHGIRWSYSDVAPGEALALIDSNGFLELAVNRGDATRQPGLCRGDTIEVLW